MSPRRVTGRSPGTLETAHGDLQQRLLETILAANNYDGNSDGGGVRIKI
jgi:hypothetical protein